MKQAVLFLITFYQKAISPYAGMRCRFYPSCSEYARAAISDRGVIMGMLYAVRRILRCHPFSSSGFDPYLSQKDK